MLSNLIWKLPQKRVFRTRPVHNNCDLNVINAYPITTLPIASLLLIHDCTKNVSPEIIITHSENFLTGV